MIVGFLNLTWGTFADGLALGGVYALMAVGIGLVFGVLRLVNFAYGQLVMAGGFALAFGAQWNLPLGVSILFCFAVVFALSIDDFVVTDYLSSNSSTQTVPIKIYSSVRGTTTPALNALATVMVVATLIAVVLAAFVYRRFTKVYETGKGGAVGELAALEA